MGLCERFGCLPSQLMAEGGGLFGMLTIEGLGRRYTGPGDAGEGVA